jgi:DNA-binding PadR family transcriptional regulator
MRMSTTSTDLAVLGALSVEPMSGYALREAIRDVLGHFWSESFGQIYPALASLEAEGFVERIEGSRPTASLFAITAAGRERLRELVRAPLPSRPPRHGALLRLYFGRHLGSAGCLEIVDGAHAQAIASLATYAAIRAEIEADTEHTDDAPFWLTTLDFGERTARATVEWAEATRRALGATK